MSHWATRRSSNFEATQRYRSTACTQYDRTSEISNFMRPSEVNSVNNGATLTTNCLMTNVGTMSSKVSDAERTHQSFSSRNQGNCSHKTDSYYPVDSKSAWQQSILYVMITWMSLTLDSALVTSGSIARHRPPIDKFTFPPNDVAEDTEE